MPRCWTQSGNEYQRKWYIDDDLPPNVAEANHIFDSLLARCKELNVDIVVRDGNDKGVPLSSSNCRVSFFCQNK